MPNDRHRGPPKICPGGGECECLRVDNMHAGMDMCPHDAIRLPTPLQVGWHAMQFPAHGGEESMCDVRRGPKGSARADGGGLRACVGPLVRAAAGAGTGQGRGGEQPPAHTS